MPLPTQAVSSFNGCYQIINLITFLWINTMETSVVILWQSGPLKDNQ